MPETIDLGEPRCGICGHSLQGCVDSARCPECGRPIIEVLVRGQGKWGRRYKSNATLMGLPIIHVALGATATERIGRARGIIAIGDDAMGWIAIGGRTRGIVAIGGMSMGCFSLGGMSLGAITSCGGVSIGGMSSGGLSLGVLSQGGVAAGWVAGGGMAIGQYASGGGTIGKHILGRGVNDPAAVAMFDSLSFFFGNGAAGFSPFMLIQPFIAVIGLTAIAAATIGVIAMIAKAKYDRTHGEEQTFQP
ncbi:MAG: hypothetical protein AAF432_12440 [Planctomycetota bacterium]